LLRACSRPVLLQPRPASGTATLACRRGAHRQACTGRSRRAQGRSKRARGCCRFSKGCRKGACARQERGPAGRQGRGGRGPEEDGHLRQVGPVRGDVHAGAADGEDGAPLPKPNPLPQPFRLRARAAARCTVQQVEAAPSPPEKDRNPNPLGVRAAVRGCRACCCHPWASGGAHVACIGCCAA